MTVTASASSSMPSRRVPLTSIAVRDRLRPVDAAWAEALAASMAEVGQLQPITVRRVPMAEQPFQLVIGLHRLTAASLLGWSEIEIIESEMGDEQARISEIDENLMRHELTMLDRAVFLAERKAVWERLHPETAQGKAPKGKKKQQDGKVAMHCHFSERFTKDAAKRTGLSERSIRDAVHLASLLAPEAITLLRATDAAKQRAQVKDLASLSPDDQIAAARQLVEGKANSVKAASYAIGARIAPQKDPQEAFRHKFIEMWSRMNAKARRQALADIGAVVAHADRSAA